MLNNIKLVKPDLKYENEILNLKEELAKEGSEFNGCSNLEDYLDISKWLEYLKMIESKKTCPPYLVPATTYLCFNNDTLVGIINIRHSLNENLKKIGGHIGYSILPQFRNQGMGTKMLELALEKTRDLGLSKVLITCHKENSSSKRVIQKNNGIYENTIICGDEEIERYWIKL